MTQNLKKGMTYSEIEQRYRPPTESTLRAGAKQEYEAIWRPPQRWMIKCRFDADDKLTWFSPIRNKQHKE